MLLRWSLSTVALVTLLEVNVAADDGEAGLLRPVLAGPLLGLQFARHDDRLALRQMRRQPFALEELAVDKVCALVLTESAVDRDAE